jgi:hypothetical protein
VNLTPTPIPRHHPPRTCGKQFPDKIAAENWIARRTDKPRIAVECHDKEGCGAWHVKTVPQGPGLQAKPKDKSAARKRRGSSSGKIVPPAPGEFTPKVKLMIRTRAGHGDPFDACCESCGVFIGETGGEFSHRDPRGMGGSRNPVTNGPANGTLACGSGALKTGCHGRCEVKDPDMHAMGFWLEEGEDPRTTPIMWHGAGSGVQLFLAPDGTGDTGYGYSFSGLRIGEVA